MLIGISRFASLNDKLSCLAASLFDRIQQFGAYGEAIAVADRFIPFEIGAAIKPLDTTQLGRHDRRVNRV